MPAPAISTLSIGAGTPGTPVVIEGGNFGPQKSPSTVQLRLRADGARVAPAPIDDWKNTRIEARVPALDALGSGGIADLWVRNADGVESQRARFTVHEPAAPALERVDPAAASEGATVILDGRGFGMAQFGTAAVLVGDRSGAELAATVRGWGATRIEISVPAAGALGGPGDKLVRVRTLWGESNGLPFSIASAPTLNAVRAPERPGGPVQALPGDVLLAEGTGFGATRDTQGAVLVAGQGGATVAAEIAEWRGERIRFLFPEGTGAPGPKQVSIRTRWGTSAPATIFLEGEPTLPAEPVAMLPLGLQTRFMAGGNELWVRAIPDTIHVDSHDGRLTEEEALLGERYRDAGADRADVWLDISTRFGAPRAEWIVRSTLAGSPIRRSAPWARAARSRLLPRRLYAFAYDDDGGLLASGHGRPIPFELPIGPDPAGADAARDPGVRWLVDFDEALARGMAIKVLLPDPPPARIARLVVVGVETSLTATEGADELAGALAAHRYTRGIGFLPEGAPTNNPPASAGSNDAPAPPTEAPDPPVVGTNAHETARALGLTSEAARLFDGTPHAADGGALRRARRNMNAALWPATWGYFIEHLLAPVVAHDRVESGRQHFVEWVRGCGPQPVLRIGGQPLGLLPVVPLGEWAPESEGALEPLARFIKETLRPIWNASVAGVPRVGDEPGLEESAENPLLTVLSMQPTSISFRGRSVLAMEFVEAAWRFIRNRLEEEDLPLLGDEWKTEQRALARAILGAHGLGSWNPKVIDTVFAANYFPIELPLVFRGDRPRSQPLPVDWISLLGGAGWKALREDDLIVGERPLLYLLLRHSLLAAYLTSAGEMPPADPWRGGEQVLYGIDEIDDNLDWPRPPVAWDRLEDHRKGAALDAQPEGLLASVKDALGELAGQPIEVLERAAAETLDLCSHRLDAWIASFAQRRLRAIRGASGAGGLHLGAYGLVENVERGDGGGSAGYVHTPSPAHASAAAILASGYRSHSEGVGARSPFGIDLSSERVRVALSLLDGVRAGHQLGALLGYRFERSLQEGGLARFIQDLRQIAPLQVTGMAEAGATSGWVASQNVVDGLELHRRWVDAGRELPDDWPVGSAGDDLQEVLDGLDDAVDAIGDILVTEGVFQMARGNAERASAALGAASRPGGAPPELEAIYTPHSGVAAIHRLMVVLPGGILPAPGWQPDVGRRAAAEPRLDAWAGRLLGDPKRVRYRVEYLEPEDDAVIAGEERRLDQLSPALSPLDVVYAAVASERTQLSEIEQRIVYDALRRRPAGVPPEARVRVVGSRQPELEQKVGLLELMELAQSLREAISGARPLTPDDLSVPEAPGSAEARLADIEDRTAAAEAALRAGRAALEAALAAPAGEALRAALLQASALGVPGAVPLSAFGDGAADRSDLGAQASVALAEIERRLARLEDLDAPPVGDTPARIDHAIGRLGCVFGSGFRAAPLYVAPPASDPSQLDVGFGSSAGLLGGDRFAAVRWFQRLTRVREGARRLGDALLYADALGGADTLDLAVQQLPSVPNDRWLGLPFANGQPPVGRVSLVAHLPAGPPDAGTLAGLVFEEFTEVLAAPAKTTGLALHYDQPNASPPQAMVLAVPPPSIENWTLATLEEAVHSTLELAKVRMVDLDALQEAGHFLPATYLGLNLRGITVATDFLAGRGVGMGRG
ncbi:MAG: uncharacterized protein K0S15_1357 [Solirubrobacterales bacterium]|nr:uncharacterized protein [Solirubrobacterales bacterium]